MVTCYSAPYDLVRGVVCMCVYVCTVGRYWVYSVGRVGGVSEGVLEGWAHARVACARVCVYVRVYDLCVCACACMRVYEFRYVYV